MYPSGYFHDGETWVSQVKLSESDLHTGRIEIPSPPEEKSWLFLNYHQPWLETFPYRTETHNRITTYLLIRFILNMCELLQ